MTKIIGLTGGIGSGKSTVARYIESKGISVYIADDEAKKIMNSSEVILEVKNHFGEKVISKGGVIKRKALARIVFNDKEKLSELNKIVHPRVKEHFREWLKIHSHKKFIIKEVAILFETNGHLECDKVILVTAPKDIRIKRVVKRDSISEKEVLERINNQLSEEEKIKMADYIINNIKLEDTYNQVDELLKLIEDSQ